MSNKMLSQLRDYGSVLEDAQDPLTVSEVISRAQHIQTLPDDQPAFGTGSAKRRVKAVVFAAGLVVLVVVSILLASLQSEVPPAGTTIPGPDLSTTVPGPNLPTTFSTYEAVFLRLEVLDDTLEGPVLGSTDTVVAVVGVNPQGEEREIARLPGAWVAYWPPSGAAYLRPLGAVSPTGLLAIPREHGGGRLMMQWVIFDLLNPDAEPVIIEGVSEHVELVGRTPYYPSDLGSAAFWGPDERLAITWGPIQSGLLSFVDGRSGTATTLELPGESWAPFPAWAADGSGVFITGEQVIHPDGTRTYSPTAIREDSCNRQFESGGAAIPLPSGVETSPLACLAPDDSMIVFNQENTYYQSSSGVLSPGEDTWAEVDGSFAGWLGVNP